MKKYFSIGETAKINNVSIQALRLYDKMGLLKPAYIDSENNYRYYTVDQFVYIDLIKYSKLIGAPLKELNEVLYKKDVSSLLLFIKRQQDIVEKEIIRLKNVSNAIGHIESKINYALELKETNKVFLRSIKKRFYINSLINKKDEVNDIEIKLRKIDKILEENEIMFEGETGYFIDFYTLINEGKIKYESLYSTIIVDNSKSEIIEFKEIPEGNYLCIAYINNEKNIAIDKIIRYIKENDIKTKGIGLEIQIFNTLNVYENDDLLFEVQILI